MKKRLLASLLSLAMVLTMLPSAALAAGNGPDTGEPSEDTPTCICTELCTEAGNPDCPVCLAGYSACKGMAPEGMDGEPVEEPTQIETATVLDVDDVTIQSGDSTFTVVTVFGNSIVQSELEGENLDTITKLKVITADGAALTKEDFQFLSGVIVSATNDGRYSSVYAGSDSYSGDDIIYLKNLQELDLSDAVCVENAIPARAFQRNTTITKIILPDTLERTYLHAFSMMTNLTYLGTEEGNLTFPDSMRIMGEGMVYDCGKLEGTLHLPENLEAIGSSCFFQSGVSGTVTIPSGVNITVNTDIDEGVYNSSASTFNGTNITAIVFEDGVTAIPDNFASHCPNLDSVTIPDSVTEIGSYAFSDTALTELPVMEGVTKIGDHAFSEIETFTADIILNGDVEMEERVFQEIKTTGKVVIDTDVVLPVSIFTDAEIQGNVTISAKTIPSNAFYRAKINGSIVLQDGLREIESNAFSGITVGENSTLTLPSSLRVIGDNAFYNAEFTGTLTLPSFLTEIGDYAFYGHTFTGSLTIPGGVETIGTAAFRQANVNDNTVDLPGFNGTLTISEGVKTISDDAFYGNGFTGSLTLPDSVQSVGKAAFGNCGFNGTLTLSDNLQTIGNSAFRKNEFNGDLIVPKSVTSIGVAAFSYVGTLNNIVIENENVVLSKYAFLNQKEGVIIYIPEKIGNTDNYWAGTSIIAITKGGTFASNANFAADALAIPIKDGSKFDGWYTDPNFTTDNKVEEGTTISRSNTYYAKWTESIYNDPGDWELGTMTYGHLTPKTFTVSLKDGQSGTPSVKSAVSSNMGVFTTEASGATVTVTPSSNLPAGTYQETITVTTGDEVFFFVNVSLTVAKAGSVVTPGEGSDTITATYGETITLTAEVAKAQTNGIALMAAQDEVKFLCGETSLGTALVRYSDDSHTAGTATLTYDTRNGGIPVGTSTITAVYGGSVNLNGSNKDSIWVTLNKINTSIDITPDRTSLTGGGTVTLTVTGLPDGASATVTASPSVTISGSGSTFTATLPNSTEDYTFTASYTGDENHNASSDTCTVSVTRRSSGGGGGGGGSTTYTVSTDAGRNGDVTVSPSRASYGRTVTITVEPDEGYELDELIVTDADGDEIDVERVSATRYTFEMPRSRVTVEATFVEITEEPDLPTFTDVPEGAYYYDAVAWAVENGVTSGTSATTFSPDASCTRAQMVTFLWRAAGSPEPESIVNPFADVSASAYYYDAVLWAVEQGITNGTSATTFGPDATVTRGQTVTFLWRYDGSTAVSGSGFVDVASDAYYATAVAWAVSEGVTNGTSATTFSPDNDCTRGQIVTFLYRYMG